MTIPDARIRREPPVRSAPLRSPLHGVRGPHDPARRTVEAAVETAYRVYEDYVRWGRESAAQRAEGRTTMGPKMLDPQSALTQWMGIWQEMYRAWMGAFTPLGQAAPGMFGFDPMTAFQPPTPQTSSFDLTVETSRRTRLSLTWLRPPGGGTLRAQLIREEGEGRLALELDPSALRIEIPPQQPAGTYSGIVRDAKGEQLGMLTLQLY